MIMLFIAFLRVHFNRSVISWQHLWVLVFTLTMPLIFYFLLRPFNYTLALASFCIAIAPTAAGAPVMATFLRTKVAFVTASVIFTTPVVGIVLPLLLPQLIEVEQSLKVMEVLSPTASLVFIPLILSQLIRRLTPKWLPVFDRFNGVPFYLFIMNILIATGKASHFIRFEAEISWIDLAILALGISVVGFCMFKIGEWWLGRKGLPIENGLALGRKNTMFALWIALTFINPVVALGPIFYIFFQNSYNSWQLYLLNKKAKLPIEQ